MGVFIYSPGYIARRKSFMVLFSCFLLLSCGHTLEPANQFNPQTNDSIDAGHTAIRIGIGNWIGQVGGLYFNGGLKDSKASRFFSEYGIHVKFIYYNSPKEYLEDFKNGKIDVIDVTMDMFAVYDEELKADTPQAIFQMDWSTGGDMIIANEGIQSVNDLVNKKVSFVPLTASHTLLLNALSQKGIKYSNILIMERNKGEEVVNDFLGNKADAVLICSPLDARCLKKKGSHVLMSTKEEPELIADVLLAGKSFINAHIEDLQKLAKGWLQANEEINSSEDNRQKAAAIYAKCFHINKAECLKALTGTKLCTTQDNSLFFGSEGKANGEEIYNTWSEIYNRLNYTGSSFPPWDSIINREMIASFKN